MGANIAERDGRIEGNSYAERAESAAGEPELGQRRFNTGRGHCRVEDESKSPGDEHTRDEFREIVPPT